jgi:septal ring factor EnvC (AmiA/AmiB activator)
MTKDAPNGDRIVLPPWVGKTVRVLFVLAIGWLCHQILAYPVEQERQDEGIDSLRTEVSRLTNKVEEQEKAMVTMQAQHQALLRSQTRLEDQINAQTDLIQRHDRKTRTP